MKPLLLLLLLTGLAGPALAQVFVPAEDPFSSPQSVERIRPLDPGDENKLEQQRQRIEELTLRHFGRRLERRAANDLELLQRLLDQRLVGPSDTFLLQAMGVVLGDVYAREFGLAWVNWIDRQGKSRALRIGQSEEVLFPVTMISRRAETGMAVDVRAVYETGAAIVREKLSAPDRR